MKKKSTKIITIIVTICILVTQMIPISAYALGENEPQIESISAVAIKPLIEEIDGYMTTDYSGEEPVEYFMYCPDNCFEYTITYNGGQTFTTQNDWELSQFFESDYGPQVSTHQGPDNQWDIGKHNVTLTFMGKSCEVEVEVVKNPVESISAVAIRTIIEGLDGYMTTDWLPDGQTDQYFKYNTNYCFEYTVTYDGGQTFTTQNSFELTRKFGTSYFADVTTDQSFNNQWGIGKHNVTVTFMEKSCEAEVEVVKNPIESITAVATKPLIEQADGYLTYDSLPDGQTDKYYRYSLYNILEYTVVYDGGQTYTAKNSFELTRKFGTSYFADVTTDQSFNNQWGIGKHNVTVTFMGKSCEAEVEVVKNPIESITAVATKTLMECSDGYMTTDNLPEGETDEYFKYSTDDIFEYTVTYNGGQTFTAHNSSELIQKFGEGYYLQVSTDQSFDNQWGIGKHNVTITYMGKSCETEVEVVQSPIDSISAVAIKTIIEGTGGYSTSDWTPDGQTDEYYKYMPNNIFEYTVTYDGGQTFTTQNSYSLSQKFGVDYYPIVTTDQSFDNQWGIGKHNVTISFMGKSCETEVEVVKSLIESISAVAIRPLIEGVDGYMSSCYVDNESCEYFVYTPDDVLEYTVTYDGGKTFTTQDSWELTEKFGVNSFLDYRTEQDYENQWGIGKHNVRVSFMGKSCQTEVEVIKNPIESISVVATGTIMENMDGYMTWDWLSLEDHTDEYFAYVYDLNQFEFTVTYDSGKTFTGNAEEVENQFGYWPNVTDDQSYENQWGIGKHIINVEFMNNSCDTEIEVVKSPYKGIKISGENNLTISFIKNDDSVINAKILNFEFMGSNPGLLGGVLKTDIGTFMCTEFSYYCNEDGSVALNDTDIQLIIGKFKSNVLKKNNWLKMLDYSGQGIGYLSLVATDENNKILYFNGKVTPETLDDVIAFSVYATGYLWKVDIENVVIVDDRIYFSLDNEAVKDTVAKCFNIDGVDFTLSGYYDAETGRFLVPYFDFGYDSLDLLCNFDNITEEWTITGKLSDSIITIKYDKNGVITSIYKAHSHAMTEHTMVAATCTDVGSKTYYECSICHKLFFDEGGTNEISFADTVLPVIPHSYPTTWSKDVSGHWKECQCGNKAQFSAHSYDNACDTTCNICGYVRTITHSYSNNWSSDGTNHWHACTVCGNKTDIAAHTGGKADCVHKAECSICGATYGSVDQSNHKNTEIRGATDPTCSKEGYTGDVYCKDCGVKISTGSIIVIVPHKYVDTVIPPSGTEMGYTLHKCSVCGAEYKDAFTDPATGHVVENWTITKQATSESSGTKTGVCSICGATVTVDIGKLVSKITGDKTEGNIKATIESVDGTKLYEDIIFSALNITDKFSEADKATLAGKINVVLKGNDNRSIIGVLDLSLILRDKDSSGAAIKDQKYQPGSKVRVTLEIPQEWLTQFENVSLNHIKADGSVEEVKFTINGSTITFETDEFSNYALAGTAVKKNTDNNTQNNINKSITSPKTGDSENIFLWVVLASISVILLVGIAFTTKKRNK